MVCKVAMQEKPKLNNPVLIEGLPGIGFIANITALHLIRELDAIRFAEIRSSSFQDYAVTVENGQMRYPTNELYYYRGKGEERDLIILYGNTQALTTKGQYELCNKVLDLCQKLGCSFVMTLGGLKMEKKIENPKIYGLMSLYVKNTNEIPLFCLKTAAGTSFHMMALGDFSKSTHGIPPLSKD